MVAVSLAARVKWANVRDQNPKSFQILKLNFHLLKLLAPNGSKVYHFCLCERKNAAKNFQNTVGVRNPNAQIFHLCWRGKRDY